jgi:hypothetical protein
MLGAATQAAVWPFAIISKGRVPLTTHSTAVFLLSAVHASIGIFMHEVRTHFLEDSKGFLDFDRIMA